ncbi:stage II sporulation protein D [Longirhabdus pacifica]|uniref:stage II sporulation protein D n=1 Tax=Longirhabdus pacifica TaxID=2305227 RepID=UPI001008B2CF|nr:stage II sporulation protein D [Longirhabdus pacifica]
MKREWKWFILSTGFALAFTLIIPMVMKLGDTDSTQMNVKMNQVNNFNASQLGEQEQQLALMTLPQHAKHKIVSIYMDQQEQIIQLPLEQYVMGVVAAEMPMDFHIEALKAQAIAARTYIVRRMMDQDRSHVPVDGALVTNTIYHQAFLTEEERKQQWGKQYDAYNEKLQHAIAETKDMIMTYHDRPIEASFFSTSNGFTENSEDYWDKELPYLRSVASPWDQRLSPKYEQTQTFTLLEIQQMLGLSSLSTPTEEWYQLLSATEGNRVNEVVIAGNTFSGREVREKLKLPSSHFVWKMEEDDVHITTYGYGHGIGMSQYGAQGMALEGKKAADIVTYYYQQIELKRIASSV